MKIDALLDMVVADMNKAGADGDSWRRSFEFIHRANAYDCPVCNHLMASHDGIRRCHQPGCGCGR